VFIQAFHGALTVWTVDDAELSFWLMTIRVLLFDAREH
jgi:hypothetical protein